MASTYYDSSSKDVSDGNVAYAADLNNINTAVDTALQLVEADILAVENNQSYYTDLSQKWAENPEDTAVVPGSYSALHWAAKADADAAQTAADRIQTGLDAVATAADRVQTGLDAIATAADRVQTDLDAIATAADRVQTGLDVIAAAGSASDASDSVVAATSLYNQMQSLGFKNKIINGNFDIWQRAASQTLYGYGSDDRWYNFCNQTTQSVSRVAFTAGQTDVPSNPKYYSRTVVSSVSSPAAICSKTQRIERVSTFAGETATLSFYAKADASKNIAITFAQYFGTGGSPSLDVPVIGAQLVALTSSWARYEITVAIPSITGKTIGTNNDDCLAVHFWFDAGSDWDADLDSLPLGQQSGTFDFSQIQLEAGSTATSFEQRPVGFELSLCQRYYEGGQARGVSSTYTTTFAQLPGVDFAVTKRAAPATVEISSLSHVGNTGTPGTLYALYATTSKIAPVYNWTGATAGASFLSSYNWTADAEL